MLFCGSSYEFGINDIFLLYSLISSGAIGVISVLFCGSSYEFGNNDIFLLYSLIYMVELYLFY